MRPQTIVFVDIFRNFTIGYVVSREGRGRLKIYLILDKFLELVYYQFALIILIIHNYRS